MPKNTDVFTSEEISLAKSYIDKWDKIVFSTQPIDRERATKAIEDAYKFLQMPVPDILFFPSPPINFSGFNRGINDYLSLKQYISDRLKSNIAEKIGNVYFPKQSIDGVYFSDRYEIKRYFMLDRLDNRFEYFCNQFYSECSKSFDEHMFFGIFDNEFRLTTPWLYDLNINCTGIEYDLDIWNIWKSLCEECPYLLPFDNLAIVIDRPSELYLDAELFPHAEGKAAIKFLDGYELYCHHGHLIPEKYGKIVPDLWSVESIVAERNSEYLKGYWERTELLDILIRTIGCKRFCQELPQFKDEFWQYREQQVTFVYPSLDIIENWQLVNLYEDFYLEEDSLDVESRNSGYEIRRSIENLPYKLPKELIDLHQTYQGDYQLAPGLYFYSLIKASFQPEDNSTDAMARFPLCKGDRDELYYIRCDRIQRSIAPVYCVFPGGEPMVYAECVTSLIMTISECYRSGAYYTKDSREIQVDLDKVEPIFEKFNPNQIDNWRKIWKS